MVFARTVKEGVMSDTSEKLVLIPDNLGAGEVVGMADFSNNRGTPGGVDGVLVLATGNFRGMVCLLPAVNESTAGTHEHAYKTGGHI